jgi:hypothetical protein
MSEYTRHHFVPQFSLRAFANDARQKQIGTYLLRNGKYIPSTSIRAQAQRANLYGSDKTEQALSKLEGRASAAINRMLQKLEMPTRLSEDHVDLLQHILFQSSRTPTASAEF